MKLFGIVPPLLIAAWLGIGLGGCGGGDDDGVSLPAGVAARVGGAEVRDAAVRSRMDADYKLQGGSIKTFGPPDYPACVAAKKIAKRPGESAEDIQGQCEFEFDIARARAVDDLVHEQWVAREARRRGISAAGSPAERALRRGFKLAARVQAEPGPEMRGAVERVRARALYDKLLAAMPVSEAEVLEHARSNNELFLPTEVRRLQILQTLSPASAKQARRQLDQGESWSAVQDRYGLRPFAQHWTGTHTVKKATAPHDAFGRSMFSARPREVVGPIKSLNGWFVFEVLEIRPPARRGMSRSAHDVVVDTLRSRKLAQTLKARYGRRTVCDERYSIPEAPTCQ